MSVDVDEAEIEAACNWVAFDYPELDGSDFDDAVHALLDSGGIKHDVFGDGLFSFTSEATEELRAFVETVLPVRWRRRRANRATYHRARLWAYRYQRTRLHRTRSPRISGARRRRAGTRGSPSRSTGGDDPPPPPDVDQPLAAVAS